MFATGPETMEQVQISLDEELQDAEAPAHAGVGFSSRFAKRGLSELGADCGPIYNIHMKPVHSSKHSWHPLSHMPYCLVVWHALLSVLTCNMLRSHVQGRAATAEGAQ